MIYIGYVYMVIWVFLTMFSYVIFLNYRMKENLKRFVSFWGMFVNAMFMIVFMVIFLLWPITLLVMWVWNWARHHPYEI